MYYRVYEKDLENVSVLDRKPVQCLFLHIQLFLGYCNSVLAGLLKLRILSCVASIVVNLPKFSQASSYSICERDVMASDKGQLF